MIDRYTKSQIQDFLLHNEEPFIFVMDKQGHWGVGYSTGSLSLTGNVSLGFAWDLDPEGELLQEFGNGDRGYSVKYPLVIAMFVESDLEQAKEFLEELKRIDAIYKEDCKVPLLKMQTSVAVLQARMNP